MKIYYIGFKGLDIKIKYENGFDKCAISSDEKAKPEFYSVFANLKNVFDEITELPSSYDKIFITSIVITYENQDIKSILVCGEMKLKKSLGSLKIQTPLKNFDDLEIKTVGKDIPTIKKGLSSDSQKTIRTLINEACDFVSGDRNQANLFGKEFVRGAIKQVIVENEHLKKAAQEIEEEMTE